MRKMAILIMISLTACGENKTSTTDTKIDSSVVDSAISITNNKAPQKRYSLDEIYNQYINPQLLEYLENTHPTWSVPNQNMWHPQLFKKYSGDSTLVNYVSGDFNCDGLKDYALLVDKGNNMLAAVAFIKQGNSFKTQELTEFPYRNTERIEDHLKVFTPGSYKTEDPDIDPADRKLTLKCAAVAIGPFKELYEGGKDVYYWEKGELRSSIIED